MENPIKFTHADAHKFSAFRSLFEVVDVRKDFLAGQEWKTMSVKREIVGGKQVAFPFHVSSHGCLRHAWHFSTIFAPELGLDGHLLRSGSSWSSGSLDVLEKLSDIWHQKNDAEIEEREILKSCAKPSAARKQQSL